MQISVTAGAKPEEISWTMRCARGERLSGGAPFKQVAQFLGESNCEWHLYDSADDGWNGAEITLIGEAGTILNYGGKPAGASAYRVTTSALPKLEVLDPTSVSRPPNPPRSPPAPPTVPRGTEISDTAALRSALSGAHAFEPLELVLSGGSRFPLGGELLTLGVQGGPGQSW